MFRKSGGVKKESEAEILRTKQSDRINLAESRAWFIERWPDYIVLKAIVLNCLIDFFLAAQLIVGIHWYR